MMEGRQDAHIFSLMLSLNW